MSATTLDASLTARMFLAGARRLEKNKEWINELNVFPVPDGDTGTNMSLTIMSAVNEVTALSEVNMTTLAKAISSGSLRGARGNSGVILSQLIRGFGKVIRDQEEMTTQVLTDAFIKATETAYKAVMKPKEGTILTVARGMSEAASAMMEENPDIEMDALLAGIVEQGNAVLEQTPEMLPVLKEAGVVDSGGQGLMEMIKGAYDVFCGKEPNEAEEEVQVKEEVSGYCVEMMITPAGKADEDTVAAMRTQIQELDEEAVVIAVNGSILIHAHTEHPGVVVEHAAGCGKLAKVKIESLADEHRHTVISAADLEKAKDEGRKAPKAPRKDVGFIAVAAGEGLCSIFKELGVDHMIEGGQTMNPSTEDVLNAIEETNADTVFVFPNNKNIILAATQAQGLAKDTKVIVIPTKTVPQGIAAMINYMPDLSPEENEKAMYEEIANIRTCQITYSVRDTKIGDKELHEGDIMGVGDKGILAVGEDTVETAVASAKEMIDEDSELISVYYGEDVTEDEAQKLCDRLSEEYPDCEVELNAGGQPVYYYIISVE